MAKAMSITVAAADAMLAAFTALSNTSGVVRLYGGTMPTNVQTALSGNTILAEATLSATSFNQTFTTSGNNRVATANAITGDTQANASGTATFFRVFGPGGTTAVWQGTVGTTDSDMIMAETDIIANGPVNISSMTVSLPMS
jgi:hypothetical protein